ncbi:Nance-Horan syndrome protein Congenital cataracts and dental anomalies protein [Larimichthys crocea]|uniref:Nance-Horan syndrome protein Congenital cataracts and dental anomalies protein n=1 Tax=Larimichthys crocea TaxID=215358 RepID=A0A6G0J1R2_LARCR|nr:Nance-Horan syndrome protein Congenital cataracts and dental anomalies protein [Larimichthys crocea]
MVLDVIAMGNSQRKLHYKRMQMGKKRCRTAKAGQEQDNAAVSNLDIESKLSLHYQAPWHQQHNVFHPCTRPPCLEELHRNAQLSLRALHRDEQQCHRSTSRERNRVTISISVAPPMPTFPSPHSIRRQQRSRLARAERAVRETEIQTIQRKATSTGEGECGEALGGHRAKASAPNAPSTQDKQTNWSKENVPPSDQKTTADSHAISSCIIPINVTGVGFDREASARCSLVHSQSVLQRRRKLRRRKTITGIPKRVQHDMDSDESPVARERTVIVHANPHQLSLCHEDLSISGRLHHTRDSGCQTDDFLIACTAAPSRRRIRAQRGHQGIPASLSHSTGNISSLGDQSDSTYTSVAVHGGRLRSRSLPREGGRLMDSDEDDDDNYDDDDEDEELSPYEVEDFIPPGPSPRMKMMMMKDEEESTDDQAAPEPLQLGSLKRLQRSGERDRGGGGGGSPEHSWIERGRSRLPRKADMGSCEISSSSDTFSSPIHSVSTTGVLGSHVDHKEDHQSSSGNWSGSSSTCPSQTSETIPPPSSPPLTGSSHCDSELSLNTVPNAIDEGFSMDPSYHSDLRPQGQGHRSSSFTSSATDQLDDAGVSTASEGEWTYPADQDQTDPDHDPDQTQNLSQSHGLAQEYRSKQGLEDQTCFSDSKTSNTEKEPGSHYPSDTEGFYSSSVHFGECNQSYRGYMYNYADPGPDCGQSNTVAASLSHGVYPQPSTDFRAGTMTLGRTSRPLRKPKVKPPPPKRTSSLKDTSSCVDVGTDTQADQDQPKMVSEQELTLSSTDMKLELELELGGAPEPLQTSCLVAEPLGTWGMGLGETVDIVEPMSFSSADTHSFKDEGAVQSDYADLWLHNSELKSNNGEYTSMSNSSTATGTTVMECIKSPDSSSSSTETQTQGVAQASETRAASPPLPPGDFKLGSPEKLAGLASPSSGYSSQSETPTSTLPSSSAAFFPGPLSPSTGKRKPKVPERKSSLSSLQHFSRDGASISSGYKRDPDFPPPPSQLDLNVLHGGYVRHTLSHRTHHMHTLHHSKHRVASVLTTGTKLLVPEASNTNPPPSSNTAPTIPSSNLLVITPSALRSVQLHSVSKSTDSATTTDQETASGAETATRPKCPPSVSTLAPPPINTRPLPPRRPPPRPPCHDHTSSPEHVQPPPPGRHPDGPPSYESLLLRQDRYGPGTFWAMTGFRTRMDPSSEEDSSPLHRPVPRAPHPSPVDLHTHIHSHTEFRGLPHSAHAHPEFRVLGERSFSQDDDDDDDDDDEEEEEQVKEPPRAACSRGGMRSDHPPPPAYEFAGGSHLDSGPWASPVKVPGTTMETSHPYLISDARKGGQEDQEDEEEVTSGATRSAHQQQQQPQESKDDSTTPDTEDYFSKDSTPSDNSLSPLTDDTKVDDDIIITSPNKTRTTEDLFAMIHRSKRKVLGRKDSGDLNMKSRLCPVPPVAPVSTVIIPPAPPLNIPATLPTAAGSQRAPVPIYRSAKKSSTSNEEFKLLLLKKGSRSDSSYRMSATEILKSPITPKTPGEPLQEGPIRQAEEPLSTLQEPPISGLDPIQIPGLFPRANSESFTPKNLPMSAASRQGRSRIPPVANSSRYSTRSRLYTAPMQAISEGETENSDGSPHDDRSS